MSQEKTIGSSSDDSLESGNSDYGDIDYIPGSDESSSDQSGRMEVVAGYNPEKNTYSIPSLAFKLGHSLQKICSILESNAMICGNQTMAEQAKNFRIIHQARWNEFISAGAITTLKEAKWNVPQILPITEDVKLLNAYLEKKQDEYEKQLRTIPTADSYASLAKVTLA
ncbi:hypothetical protein AOLI_G00195460 [Acnodon oligacanthus]